MGGIEVTVDGEPMDPRATDELQGDDARGRAQPGHRHRLHQRLVDAEGRDHLPLRGQVAQPPPRHGLRQATPRSTDAAATGEPLLGLNAGYIQRAADRLPSQGTRDPWKVHQSYLQDHRAWRRESGPGPGPGVLQPGAPRRGRPGRRGHRCRVGHRPGARGRAGRSRHPPGPLRRRRGGPGGDRAPCARARGVKVTSAHVDVADRAARVRVGRPRGRRAWRGPPGREQRRRGARGHRRDHVRGRRPTGSWTSTSGAWCTAPRRSCPTWRPRARATSSTSRACSAWCASRHSRPTTPPSSRSAASPSPCAWSWSSPGAGVGHHHPPRWHPHQHRPQRPHGPGPGGTGRHARGAGPAVRTPGPHHAGGRGPPDPGRGRHAGKRRVLVGPDARMFDLLSRLPAGVQQRVIVAAARRRG